MIRFSGSGILLDIEGTTSSISFVYDEMFPFVRKRLARFLTERWDDLAVREACDLIAKDEGFPSLHEWCGVEAESASPIVQQAVIDQMDRDLKSTGLKTLQGLIWEAGFRSGQLKAHVYPDVLPNIQRWTDAGMDVRIYSSGSVHAQRLFFGHSIEGDLLRHFRGHYDTQTGPKRETSSYRIIADDFKLPAEQILFLSDIAAELDAAASAGFQTGLCIRPGNAAPPAETIHPALHSFDEVELSNR